ncbi:MAG TPA: coenzyme F420 hydrogenase [Bacteroidales bacterium]|nr:coenzyme F420 hydrogenase [Bacteroidales bacterium]
MPRIKSIKDVVSWGLCTGCGACFYVCTKKAVSLENVADSGIRPSFNENCENCENCTECLTICPGINIICSRDNNNARIVNGPLIEILEGYSTDNEIRYRGSSGGLLSSLALYCLERENMSFVIHTGMNEANPFCNKTVQSFNKKDLKKHAGSRYSPSSPCDQLELIEKAENPCVFIGKPCDVAAIELLRKRRPELDMKLGLVLSFFCAGVPCKRGTLDIIKSMNIDCNDVTDLRYRGHGWPGDFAVTHKNEISRLSYQESWGKLSQGCRPYRCHICPDSFGASADICCGDAWHKFNGDNIGESLVLVRKQRGKDIMDRAIRSNYIEVTRSEERNLFLSSNSLINKKKQIFGRLIAMKLLFIPIPKYKSFSIFESWLELSLKDKIRSILGSLRRLIMRGLWHKAEVKK